MENFWTKWPNQEALKCSGIWRTPSLIQRLNQQSYNCRSQTDMTGNLKNIICYWPSSWRPGFRSVGWVPTNTSLQIDRLSSHRWSSLENRNYPDPPISPTMGIYSYKMNAVTKQGRMFSLYIDRAWREREGRRCQVMHTCYCPTLDNQRSHSWEREGSKQGGARCSVLFCCCPSKWKQEQQDLGNVWE